MSVLASTADLTGRPSAGVVTSLALHEARRLMLHPVTLAGWAAYVVAIVFGELPSENARTAFDAPGTSMIFYPGVFLILAANLLASRDRRADSEEMLASLPARPEERVLAQSLAALAPAAVGAACAFLLHGYLLAADRYVVEPTPWHLLAGPVALVGACLLGQAVALWLPARGAVVVVLVGIVVLNAWLENSGDARLLGPATFWARWGVTRDGWAGVLPGSVSLHVAYLAGLCGLGLAVALLRVAERRTPALLLGLGALVVTVGAGLGQLP